MQLVKQILALSRRMRYAQRSMGLFQHALRDALTVANINQATLAANADVPQSQVSRWISGDQNPKPPNLFAILPQFDAPTQSHLLACYLTDIIPTDKRALVSIVEAAGTIQEQPPEREWPAGLSTDSKRKLCQFAALLRDYPEVEAIVDEFLRLAEKLEIEPLPTPRPPRENGHIGHN